MDTRLKSPRVLEFRERFMNELAESYMQFCRDTKGDDFWRTVLQQHPVTPEGHLAAQWAALPESHRIVLLLLFNDFLELMTRSKHAHIEEFIVRMRELRAALEPELARLSRVLNPPTS